MNRFEPPEALLDILYAAATDFSQWKVFMEGFAKLFEASAASFDSIDYVNKEASFSALYGLNPDDLNTFVENLDQDPRGQASVKYPEKPLLSQDMLPESMWKNSGMYRNVFVPFRLEHHMAVWIPMGETSGVAVGVYRPPGMEPYAPADSHRFGAFVPHFKRVIRLQRQFLNVEKERWAALSVLDDIPMGIIVTDSQTRVLFANRLAKEITRAGDGLIIRHEELWSGRQANSVALRKLVRECVDDQQYGVIAMPRSASPSSLYVRVSPINGASTPFFAKELNFPLAAVYITDPERPQETPAELLQRLYGLTPAEAKLTAQLVSGKNIQEAKHALSISENTARSQLKAVFEKTGARRQAELIKTVMESPVWAGLTTPVRPSLK